MVTLDNWRERMSEDMRLRDFRPRTQEGYAQAVRQFLDRMQRAPEALTDEDVRGYFLYLREDKKLAPSSINLAVHALRFFFVHTLGRDWPVFGLLRVHKPRMLPVVLSPAEVRAVLSAVRHPVRRMSLCTIYALGLRLGEGLRLQSGDVDSARLMVWVRDGKGSAVIGPFLSAMTTSRVVARPPWYTSVPVRATPILAGYAGPNRTPSAMGTGGPASRNSRASYGAENSVPSCCTNVRYPPSTQRGYMPGCPISWSFPSGREIAAREGIPARTRVTSTALPSGSASGQR
jgi:hypothetical protein